MKDFEALTLLNRLGQGLDLQVKCESIGGRDYVFVAAPIARVSSLIAKNAEQFARQLVEHFGLKPEKFDLIELRNHDEAPLELLHWRFDWCETIALKARSQSVTGQGRKDTLMSALAA